MPDLEAYIQLWATFLILMVVLFIVYKVASKFSTDNLKLKAKNYELERADRNRIDEAHITNMSRLVDVVTDWQKENNKSNDAHTIEHSEIMKLLKVSEETNNDTHSKMSKNIMKNTDSIEILHNDIKITHKQLFAKLN